MVVKSGRFGEYVTDGEYNATLRKDDTVESITLERAAELLAERRERGPAKKAAKKGAKKAPAKKDGQEDDAKKAAKKSSHGGQQPALEPLRRPRSLAEAGSGWAVLHVSTAARASRLRPQRSLAGGLTPPERRGDDPVERDQRRALQPGRLAVEGDEPPPG